MKTIFSFFVAIVMSTCAFAMTNEEAMSDAQKTMGELNSAYDALASQMNEAAVAHPELVAEYSARMEALQESIGKVASYATTQYEANNLQYSLEGFNETAAGVASEISEVKELFVASLAAAVTAVRSAQAANDDSKVFTLSGVVAPASYKGLVVRGRKCVVLK